MSIIQWNIRGMQANWEQIKVLFHEADASIMCLQETKLGESTPFFGHNYSFYRSPLMLGLHAAYGGAGIIIRKSINHKIIDLDIPLQA